MHKLIYISFGDATLNYICLLTYDCIYTVTKALISVSKATYYSLSLKNGSKVICLMPSSSCIYLILVGSTQENYKNLTISYI